MMCWTLEIEVIIALCFAGNSAWGGAGFCWKHEVVQVFVEGKTCEPFFLCWAACGQHGNQEKASSSSQAAGQQHQITITGAART